VPQLFPWTVHIVLAPVKVLEISRAKTKGPFNNSLPGQTRFERLYEYNYSSAGEEAPNTKPANPANQSVPIPNLNPQPLDCFYLDPFIPKVH
jgi:hypothetical protein